MVAVTGHTMTDMFSKLTCAQYPSVPVYLRALLWRLSPPADIAFIVVPQRTAIAPYSIVTSTMRTVDGRVPL